MLQKPTLSSRHCSLYKYSLFKSQNSEFLYL